MDCVEVCDFKALSENKGRLKVDFVSCTACGKCAEVCPQGSMKIYGWVTSAEEVMEEVEKDRAYYNQTGGGLTLSGGDPMRQVEFSRRLLQLARASNIHTCVETAGYATKEEFDRIIPLTDLFLFDYKLTDDFYHKRYTGESNVEIIRNLEYINSRSAEIIIRCIIVPGINDHTGHFRAITSLSSRLDHVKWVEVIPYHDYGRSKYPEIGMGEYPFKQGPVNQETADRWRNELADMGCRVEL
jgi:pyruvate formate lyase activating enzyme